MIHAWNLACSPGHRAKGRRQSIRVHGSFTESLMRYINYATQVKNIPSYEFKQMTWECRLSFWPSKMEEYLHMIGNNVHSDPGPTELKYGYDDIRIGHHIFSINSFGIGNQAHAPNCRTIHQDRGFWPHLATWRRWALHFILPIDLRRHQSSQMLKCTGTYR